MLHKTKHLEGVAEKLGHIGTANRAIDVPQIFHDLQKHGYANGINQVCFAEVHHNFRYTLADINATFNNQAFA